MKVTEINIRDPYVLYTKGKYYLYGTRSETCWGPADGFDCYISENFEELFYMPDEEIDKSRCVSYFSTVP